MAGGFPGETAIPNVVIYDPVTDIWHEGRKIPASRVRGSSGVAVYNEKLYIACGIVNGHIDGWSKKFDVYDPQTGSWTALTDAPQERDHFHAVVSDDKFYALGRQNERCWAFLFRIVPFHKLTITIFRLNSGTHCPQLQTYQHLRAGCASVLTDEGIMVCGGESIFQGPAHDECEVLNTTTQTWTNADDLVLGRHGTQIASVNDFHFMAAGVGFQGGAPRWGSIEVYRDLNDTFVMPDPILKGSYEIDPCISFQDVQVGDSLIKACSVDHIGGNQALMLDSVYVGSTGAYSIVSQFDFPIILPPGQTLDINTKFERSAGGTVVDTLYIHITIPQDTLIEVIVKAPDQLAPVINVSSDTICFGDTVQLWANNVYSTYEWSGGSTDTVVDVTSEGVYNLTVTDFDGCIFTEDVEVLYNPFIGIVSAKQFISCHNSADGRLTVNAFGGVAPYTYSWDDAQSTNTNIIDSLDAGIYTCYCH